MIDKWDISNLQDNRAMFNEINPYLLLLPKFRNTEFCYHHETKEAFNLDDDF